MARAHDDHCARRVVQDERLLGPPI